MSDWFSRRGHLWTVIVLEKSFWNTLTNRWLVPRGHSWSALIWFMVSLHRLYWDDYSGSPQGPNNTVKVTGGVYNCTQGLIGKMWGFNSTSTQQKSLSRTSFQSKAELSHKGYQPIYVAFYQEPDDNSRQRIVCTAPGGRERGINRGSTLSFSPILPVSARESF